MLDFVNDTASSAGALIRKVFRVRFLARYQRLLAGLG
jgi:hypothetical protein